MSVRYTQLPLDKSQNEPAAYETVSSAVHGGLFSPYQETDMPSTNRKRRKKKRVSMGNKRSLPKGSCKRKRFDMTDDSDDEDYKPPPWTKIPNYSSTTVPSVMYSSD
jgi:hypothetical protein